MSSGRPLRHITSICFHCHTAEEWHPEPDGTATPAILDDRAAPIYSRAQTLSDRERDLIDAALRTLGAQIITR